MAQLSPGVSVEIVPPKVVSLPVLPTAITAMLGVAERGPIADPITINAPDEYANIFGRVTGDSADLSLAVQGFFRNGGAQAVIARTVHYGDVTDPITKTSERASLELNTAGGAPSAASVQGTGFETYDLEPGQTVDLDVDGGGTVTATFDAARAAVTAGTGPTYNIPDASTLDVVIDLVVFNIVFAASEFLDNANATAAEVAVAITTRIESLGFADLDGGNPRINSRKRGTGSRVEITGGTANAGILDFSTTAVDGTGDVADIDAVTDAEAKALIEADVPGQTYSNAIGGEPILTSNTAGGSSSIQVLGSSTAIAFGFDNAIHAGDSGTPAPTVRIEGKTEGAYANELLIIRGAPTSGEADQFNLQVARASVSIIVETFANLSMDELSDSYIVTALADSSNLIRAVDLNSTASDPRPAIGTFGPLAGGDDGLIGLSDVDFIGDEGGGTGLHAFDTEQNIGIIIQPGRASAAAHLGLIDYITVQRENLAFGILDPPAGLTAQEMVDFMNASGLLELSSRAAIYWPRILILNPAPAQLGSDVNIVVAPSGHLAGVYARNDRNDSVWKAPAGTTRGVIAGMVGFETNEVMSRRRRDLVYPKRVNPISVNTGQPRHVDGNRTLKSTAAFPTIGEARGVIFVGTTLTQGLQFLKHEPNDDETRRLAERTVTAFLREQLRKRAFASSVPSEAFRVDTSTNVNTPLVIQQGKLIIDVALATAKPIDFIIVRISQDTSALEEQLAG